MPTPQTQRLQELVEKLRLWAKYEKYVVAAKLFNKTAALLEAQADYIKALEAYAKPLLPSDEVTEECQRANVALERVMKEQGVER